ncbi:MAG: hypothetical protein FJ146_13165 [Deltaproteobacteria bacterium]|nr:hypothetical protein [Deltaproteobacteria bacterium]
MEGNRKLFRESSRNLHAFFKRAGKVWIYDELRFLDLEPEMLTGEFGSDRVQTLIDFCNANPEYHIISGLDGKVFNKYIPDASIYYLADKDNDPSLMVDLWGALSGEEFLQIGYAMVTPIVGKIKCGNDT